MYKRQTHDRYFLDNVAGWILELDRGRGIPWKGNYSSWLEQKEKRLAQEDKAEDERRKTLSRELEWIRMSPKGRHAKGKARINAYEAMSHESEKRAPELEIYIPAGPRPVSYTHLIRALIIEDNQDITANLYAFLEPLGYELDCSATVSYPHLDVYKRQVTMWRSRTRSVMKM